MGLMYRRRRPVRTAAMLAGAGAVAYHAGKAHQQQSGAADQQAYDDGQAQAQPQYAPPPAAAPAPAGRDMAGELERLKHLLDEGALSPEEYEAAKRQVLGG